MNETEKILHKHFNDSAYVILEFLWNNNLKYFDACEIGYYEKVTELIQSDLPHFSFDIGLEHACLGGHMLIINLMIKHGAKYWEWGLFGACLGGHMGIVKLMIKYGAKNWEWGLFKACNGGHTDVAEFMIKCGGDWDEWKETQYDKNNENHVKVVNQITCQLTGKSVTIGSRVFQRNVI